MGGLLAGGKCVLDSLVSRDLCPLSMQPCEHMAFRRNDCPVRGSDVVETGRGFAISIVWLLKRKRGSDEEDLPIPRRAADRTAVRCVIPNARPTSTLPRAQELTRLIHPILACASLF